MVFCFGLVHGLGFASALGIDQALSWTLLWSLLVFNVGIETVQLAIIMVVFPLLALLRHRRPIAGLWTTGAIAAGVAVMGLVWFVQRVLGDLSATTSGKRNGLPSSRSPCKTPASETVTKLFTYPKMDGNPMKLDNGTQGPGLVRRRHGRGRHRGGHGPHRSVRQRPDGRGPR